MTNVREILLFLDGPHRAVNEVQAGLFPVSRLAARHCIADRAYDSGAFGDWLKARGVRPVILSQPCRKGHRRSTGACMSVVTVSNIASTD